jgi:WhiB family transcriptional regulator, redox-sensing transcriptional regulator
MSLDSARDTTWMSRGACQAEDPELFFPITALGPARDQVSAAKAVCGRCSVQRLCLSYAVMNAQDGIWGGTTRDERRALHRSRERMPSGALSAVVAGPHHAPTELSPLAASMSLVQIPEA